MKEPSPESESEQGRQAKRLVYLAAERTLLLWLRTGASFIILGFAVVHFRLALDQLSPQAVPIEGVRSLLWTGEAVAAGFVLCAVSALRFVAFERRYRRGETDPGIGVVLAVVLACVLASLGAMLLVGLLLAD